jgi:uncharacterized protein YdhG (YjbR/CyaY superfamily)
MPMKPFADIDAYLADLPDDARATLQALRRTIRDVAPDAVESISYGVPTFKYKGRPLIYLAAAKNHLSLYGISVDEYRDELAGFDAEKGTVRFQQGAPPPEPLVRKMLRARIADIDASAAGRSRKSS